MFQRVVVAIVGLMTLNTGGQHVEALSPGGLVPAATQLSGKNVSKSRTEDREVIVWDVSAVMLFLEMVQLGLECLGLVKQVHQDVETSQHSLGVRLELARVGVVATDTAEQLPGLGSLSEDCPPQSLSEVLTVMSSAVCAAPLTLDLQTGQRVAVSAGVGNQRSQ